MEITIAMIKELREATAAGMGACKEALQASNGDMKEAVKYLREKGLAVAAKRVDKESKEGIVAAAVAADGKAMALAEVNCETDFVAKTDAYKEFCAKAAQVALEGKDVAETLKDDYQMLLTKTGENVKIRRTERYQLEGTGVLSSYIHMGGKIGVLVELATPCEKCAASAELAEAAHMICLQIAANAPKYIKPEDIPQAEMDQELEIRLEQMKKEAEEKGKKLPPPAIMEKNVYPGIRAKYATAVCLLKQVYVADDKQTVEKYLEGVSKTCGAPIEVKRFARLQLGA